MGLPLSLRRLTKEHVQVIIDRIADQLPGWKADLLTRAGRRIHVQFVLTAMLVYLVMAIDLPQWATKAIDKIRRSYLWRGRKEARGGHCLVAWETACSPTELGGLGISNLKNLGWALRARQDGSGYRKRSHTVLGLHCLYRFLFRFRSFVQWQLSLMLAMARIPCSGLIGGFMGIALRILRLDSLLWFRRERENCVLCSRL